MKIIHTALIPSGYDAFAVWPFIFVCPERATDQALLAHERTHGARQLRMWVLPWFIAYALSRSFRWHEEVLAYRAQIAAGGITVDAAAQLLTTYDTGRSKEEAVQALQEE